MSDRVLLLVVGAGRSGTSSFAGTMARLGFYVPPPVVGESESNPRGHYEPLWAVKFHTRILDAAGFGPVDGDPLAARRIRDAAESGGFAVELRTWLDEIPKEVSRVVVKDPRTLWVAPMWHDVATDLGFRVVYVTMLREPAGVVGSHATHYSNATEANQQLRSDTATLAGWINLNLVAEEASRGRRRTSVVYDDLLADWRASIRRVGSELDLAVDVSADGARAREVDGFVDPALHRVHRSWDGSRIPSTLRDVADGLWGDLVAHAHGDLEGDVYAARIAEHRSTFTMLYTAAEMIARDRTRRAVQGARRAGRSAGLDDAAKAIGELRGS